MELVDRAVVDRAAVDAPAATVYGAAHNSPFVCARVLGALISGIDRRLVGILAFAARFAVHCATCFAATFAVVFDILLTFYPTTFTAAVTVLSTVRLCSRDPTAISG